MSVLVLNSVIACFADLSPSEFCFDLSLLHTSSPMFASERPYSTCHKYCSTPPSELCLLLEVAVIMLIYHTTAQQMLQYADATNSDFTQPSLLYSGV